MAANWTALVAILVLYFCAPSRPVSDPKVRYLTLQEAQETLQLYAGSGIPGSEISTAARWDHWIREQDKQVRSRIDRGTEDSISNLILFGTSFTELPRLQSAEDALAEMDVPSEPARQRVHAFVAAIGKGSSNERLQFVRSYLERKQIRPASTEMFLTGNLVRFAKEQREYADRLKQAGSTKDLQEVFSARSTLYETRGLSVDTSLLPNFALEETLAALVAKGVLKPGSMRRIAVIGPGLDFTDKREGYDFYPLQTIQPFAVIEALLRTGLANDSSIHLTTFDLNEAVTEHVSKLAANGRRGQPYTLQLPRDTEADWNPAAVAYWEHFGDLLGGPVQPLPVPAMLPSVKLRAVAVRPELAADLDARDLNIVAETMDFPEGRGFDLVVATNILVYYDRFQQALAMSNIARMMDPSGIFLANDPLPAEHDRRLKYLGRKTVPFSKKGEYGDDVVVYRRQ